VKGLSPAGGQNRLEQYIPINTAMVGSSWLFMAHKELIKKNNFVKIKLEMSQRFAMKHLETQYLLTL